MANDNRLSKVIGTSKALENACNSAIVRLQGVRDYHLYDSPEALFEDLAVLAQDLPRIQRLIIKLQAERGGQ